MKRTILYLFIGLLNCGLIDQSTQKETTTTKYLCYELIALYNTEVDIEKKKKLEEGFLICMILKEIDRKNKEEK